MVDSQANLVFEQRKLLKVPSGKRGISQSEAFFQHNKNLPLLFTQAQPVIKKGKLKAVSASIAPRPVFNSYMPVFLLGSGYGRAIASVNSLPFIETTHQEGHIMAGIWSAKMEKISDGFLSVHLSGGTTEIIEVVQKDSRLKKAVFNTAIIGESQDLHVGQFIDRIGVALGLGFPAGKELEGLAETCYRSELRFPSVVRDCYVSFSGPETAAQRAIQSGKYSKEEIAWAVLDCISRSIYKLVLNCLKKSEATNLLFIGGVAGNKYLRTYLQQRLNRTGKNLKLFFAEPAYSSDNAVGVALLGLECVQH